MRTQVASSSEQTTHHLDPRRWLMLVVILCATFMGALHFSSPLPLPHRDILS